MALYKRLDLGLAIMDTAIFRGKCWSRQAIARICGCSPSLIRKIEQRALKKLHKRLLATQTSGPAQGSFSLSQQFA